MTMRVYGPITLTANASGTVTVTENSIFGRLHEVIVVPSTDVLSNAWDLEITRITGDIAETLFQTYSCNTYTQGNMFFYPRVQITTTLGGGIVSGTNQYTNPVIMGGVSIKGINMGNATTAYVWLVVDE